MRKAHGARLKICGPKIYFNAVADNRLLQNCGEITQPLSKANPFATRRRRCDAARVSRGIDVVCSLCSARWGGALTRSPRPRRGGCQCWCLCFSVLTAASFVQSSTALDTCLRARLPCLPGRATARPATASARVLELAASRVGDSTIPGLRGDPQPSGRALLRLRLPHAAARTDHLQQRPLLPCELRRLGRWRAILGSVGGHLLYAAGLDLRY